MASLHTYLQSINNFNADLSQLVLDIQKIKSGSDNVPTFPATISKEDIFEAEKYVLTCYEENSIMRDAIDKRQTVEESLEELAFVNKGLKRLLPRNKNISHNKRLDDLNELVTVPSGFHCNGIFEPDNLITTSGYITLMFGIAGYFTDVGLLNQDYHATLTLLKVSLPAGPIASLGLNTDRLVNKLPIKKAQYVDQKISEHYNQLTKKGYVY